MLNRRSKSTVRTAALLIGFYPPFHSRVNSILFHFILSFADASTEVAKTAIVTSSSTIAASATAVITSKTKHHPHQHQQQHGGTLLSHSFVHSFQIIRQRVDLVSETTTGINFSSLCSSSFSAFFFFSSSSSPPLNQWCACCVHLDMTSSTPTTFNNAKTTTAASSSSLGIDEQSNNQQADRPSSTSASCSFHQHVPSLFYSLIISVSAVFISSLLPLLPLLLLSLSSCTLN